MGSINYKYIGATVVLLLIAYFLLTFKQEKVLTGERGGVKTYTSAGIHHTDPNIFIMWLGVIRSSIAQCRDIRNTPVVRKYLICASANTRSYINQNTIMNNIRDDDAKIKGREISHPDANGDLHHDIDDLLSNIRIIETMVKRGVCKNGTLNMQSLDEFCRVLVKSSENVHSSKILGSDESANQRSHEMFMEKNALYQKHVERSATQNSRMLDVSQDNMSDSAIGRLPSMHRGSKVFDRDTTSHAREIPSDDIIQHDRSMNKQYNSSLVYADAKKQFMLTRPTLDSGSRSSLAQASR